MKQVMKSKNFLSLIFGLFLNICIFSNTLFAAPPVILTGETGKYLLNKHTDILEDKKGNLTLKEVLLPSVSNKFIPNKKESINFAFSDSSYWLRIHIISSFNEDKKWLFEIAFPHQDYIDFYYVQNLIPVTIVKTGDRRFFNTRQYPNKNFLFDVSTKPGQDSFIYIRVQSEDGLHEALPLILWDPDEFADSNEIEQNFIGIYLGIMIAMEIYNLFFFLSLRDRTYLYYTQYITSFILWIITYYGFFFKFFCPNLPWISEEILIITTCLMIINSVLFSLAYLRIAQYAPKINKILISCAIISFCIIVFSFFGSYSKSFQLISILIMTGGPFLFISGIISYRSGYRPAKYYLFAWTSIIIGCILLFCKIHAIVPSFFITENSFQIGSVIGVILLALGLADRVNQERQEKIFAQQETLIAQQKASEAQLNAIENLKKSDKLKDDFLSNTSHELRTPLNGIIGITESLIDGAAGDLPEKAIGNLWLVVQSGKRLASLINDILDFSKLKNREMQISKCPVDIHELTEVVLSVLKPLTAGKSLELKNEISIDTPFVIGDENRLQQIMHNLIGNAIKFTESGTVYVSARVKGDKVQIDVSDTGIGISEDKFDKIFQSFEQGDGSIEREYGGTGLGLSVTKSLVELHGGKIWVESEPGKGSTFSLTLFTTDEKPHIRSNLLQKINTISIESVTRNPLNDRRKNDIRLPDTLERRKGFKDRREKVITQNLNGINILAVDDEPINLQVISNNLSMLGAHIESTYSGTEAIKKIDTIHFDLILLDIMMPIMNGYETAKKIRNKYSKEEVPIIFLTAKNQVSDLVDGFSAGGNDYLTKPISKNELITRIKFHVELTKSREDIRKAYIKLDLFNKELEQKIEERTRELKIAKEAAEAATKVKSEFLSNMSHEIRTPMNAIIGLSDLAIKNEFNVRQLDYLKKINISARSLLGIINDILDFSKIEAGKLEIESIDFNLKEVLDNILNVISIKAEEKNLKLLFLTEDNVPQYLTGDPLRLRQILINLANNAVKFTHEGSVCIKTQLLKEYSDSNEVMLKFFVEDTGIGMSSEETSKLFQSFSQADASTTRKYGGTGLGLSICKRLVELMGGHIGVESKAGHGSVFSFTIKLERQSEEKQKKLGSIASEIEDLSKIKGARILLVEDNEINQQVARELLESEGFFVTIANNGSEAIELVKKSFAEESPFDALLMDIQMPVMDGYTAAQKIRNDKSEIKDVPIIAMTAHALKSERDKCLHGGMNDYVTKPIEAKSLFSALIKWIKPGEREVFIAEEKDKGKISEFDIKLPDSLPGLNIAIGLKRIGDNKNLYVKLLKGLHEKYRNTANELKEANERKDYEFIMRFGHTMKGMGGNLGADRLALASRELESVIKEDQLENISEKLQSFEYSLHEVLESISQIIDLTHTLSPEINSSIKSPAEIDFKVLTPLFNELNKLLEQGQSKAKDVLISVQTHLIQNEFKELLSKMETMIDDYEFEEAQKILAEITGKLKV